MVDVVPGLDNYFKLAMTHTNHIFISYKSQQRQYALKVRDALQSWGFSTWLDQDKLKPGGSWANAIDEALKSAHAVVGVLTPDALKSRYVTNEWDMAIAKGIPFIPLLHEPTEPHYKYIDLQYIDFSHDPALGLQKLRETLSDPDLTPSTPSDPYYPYLSALYDTVSEYLRQKIVSRQIDDEQQYASEPIALTVKHTDDEVNTPAIERGEDEDMFSVLFAVGGLQTHEQTEKPLFSNLNAAFTEYKGRILLLGEPGSGKTITLLNATRDAVIRRLQDEREPLPLLGIIATWDSDKQPSIAEWLASYNKKLLHQDALYQLINAGETTLFLDGLDELGEQREDKTAGETYDPRLRFMHQIPTHNQVMVTCRVQDYHAIGEKLALNGAVTLQPLSNSQMAAYLSALPDLQAVLQRDNTLQDIARTPLLLSLFAYAFAGAEQTVQALQQLSEGDLRDKIFSTYVERRYEHEKAKRNVRLPVSLPELYERLGQAAMKNAAAFAFPQNYFATGDFEDVTTEPSPPEFVEFAVRLNILFRIDDTHVRFVHLQLRDYFAFNHALLRLQDENWGVVSNAAYALGTIKDRRAVDTLIAAFKQGNEYVRVAASNALGKIGDEKSINVLLSGLNQKADYVRRSCAEALYGIGTASVPYLLEKLYDPNVDARNEAAYSLGRLQAIPELEIALANPTADIRRAAAYGLGQTKNIAAYDILLTAINDESPPVRRNVILSIGEFKESKATPHLIELLKDETIHGFSVNWMWSSRVCDVAAEALEKIGTPEALEAVAKWRKEQAEKKQ